MEQSNIYSVFLMNTNTTQTFQKKLRLDILIFSYAKMNKNLSRYARTKSSSKTQQDLNKTLFQFVSGLSLLSLQFCNICKITM